MRLYDVGSARLLRIYTVGSGQRSSQPAAPGSVIAISWFPDGCRFLAATSKAIEVFDARHGGGGLLHRLRSPHAFTYDVLAAGSDCLITVGQDHKLGFTRCAVCGARCGACCSPPLHSWFLESPGGIALGECRGPQRQPLKPSPLCLPACLQAERRAHAPGQRVRHRHQHRAEPLRAAAGRQPDGQPGAPVAAAAWLGGRRASPRTAAQRHLQQRHSCYEWQQQQRRFAAPAAAAAPATAPGPWGRPL